MVVSPKDAGQAIRKVTEIRDVRNAVRLERSRETGLARAVSGVSTTLDTNGWGMRSTRVGTRRPSEGWDPCQWQRVTQDRDQTQYRFRPQPTLG